VVAAEYKDMTPLASVSNIDADKYDWRHGIADPKIFEAIHLAPKLIIGKKHP
jgi:hypothetical protein